MDPHSIPSINFSHPLRNNALCFKGTLGLLKLIIRDPLDELSINLLAHRRLLPQLRSTSATARRGCCARRALASARSAAISSRNALPT